MMNKDVHINIIQMVHKLKAEIVYAKYLQVADENEIATIQWYKFEMMSCYVNIGYIY